MPGVLLRLLAPLPFGFGPPPGGAPDTDLAAARRSARALIRALLTQGPERDGLAALVLGEYALALAAEDPDEQLAGFRLVCQMIQSRPAED